MIRLNCGNCRCNACILTLALQLSKSTLFNLSDNPPTPPAVQRFIVHSRCLLWWLEVKNMQTGPQGTTRRPIPHATVIHAIKQGRTDCVHYFLCTLARCQDMRQNSNRPPGNRPNGHARRANVPVRGWDDFKQNSSLLGGVEGGKGRDCKVSGLPKHLVV